MLKTKEYYPNPAWFLLLATFCSCSANKDSATEIKAGSDNHAAAGYYSMDDFSAVEKFDSHVHIKANATAFIEL